MTTLATTERIECASAALEAEVERRNEWYGLDNWGFEEVARFILEHAEPEASK